MEEKKQATPSKEGKPKFPSEDYSAKSIRMLALAPSQYGKSYAISKWVNQQVKSGERGWSYERIIVFSPTARSDPSQLMIAKKAMRKNKDWLQTNVFEYIDEDLLETLFESNKKIKESGHNPYPYLLIFDDVLCDEALSHKRSYISKIATTGRHFCISSIVSCQIFKGFIQPVVRQQISVIMIGRINSMDSVENVLNEYAMGAGETKKEALKNMIQLWEKAVQMHGNRGFLVIHAYEQWGSKKRIQMGGLDGQYIA